MIAAAVLLVVAGGLCLVDRDGAAGDHHGMSSDLCHGMVALVSLVMPVAVLVAAGRPGFDLAPARLRAARHVPDPPPEP